MDSELRAQAEAWIAQDPDPETADELRRVLDSGDEADLANRFSGRLKFGTAGLRGTLGAGPNRMNRVVVAQAAAGLAAYLNQQPGRKGRVAIGFDARRNSLRFAQDTAEILSAAGFEVFLAPRITPTPFAAFCVQHLDCDAGVMVTASHNPPNDNGYKVYAANGAQIIPPMDRDIEAEILKVAARPVSEIPRSTRYNITKEDVIEAYLQRVAALPFSNNRDLKIAYTPMHGVGTAAVLTTMEIAGFPPIAVVPRQIAPDPTFHTVAFPNPEEPGAMDLLDELASRIGADIAIANDPDADRIAVSIGGRHLTGDEVGALLGDYIMANTSGSGRMVANSLVSSGLLGAIAKSYGVEHKETLTGFKWIMNSGDNMIYGYEEALGYGVAPKIARDKDGVSAAVVFADMAASLKVHGKTVLDRLDELTLEHGYYASGQLSIRVEDLALIQQGMANVRAKPPKHLLGNEVTKVNDDPQESVYRLYCGDTIRVICRPSGTEPKLKCYLQIVIPVTGGDVASARALGGQQLEALKAEMRAALGI